MAWILGASRRASVDLPEAGSPQINTSRGGPMESSSTRSEVTGRGYGLPCYSSPCSDGEDPNNVAHEVLENLGNEPAAGASVADRH